MRSRRRATRGLAGEALRCVEARGFTAESIQHYLFSYIAICGGAVALWPGLRRCQTTRPPPQMARQKTVPRVTARRPARDGGPPAATVSGGPREVRPALRARRGQSEARPAMAKPGGRRVAPPANEVGAGYLAAPLKSPPFMNAIFPASR